MGLKVADLTVDVHAGLDTFRSELESGLQDTEAIELPIDVAVDKVQGVEGDGGTSEVAEEAAAGGAEDLLGLLGGGGGGGAVTAIATALGISATAATGILIAVGAILAVVGVISLIGMKVLQMGIQNSQIVSSINSFLNDSLGAMFDMLMIIIFAAIVGQLLPHVDGLKVFWESDIKPLLQGAYDFMEGVTPQLKLLTEAYIGAVASYIEPYYTLFTGVVWPLLETALSAMINVVFPLMELGFGYIEHYMGPTLQILADFLTVTLAPVFEVIQAILNDQVGPLLREINSVFNESIWPFLDETLMPIIALQYEIMALVLAPIMDMILQILFIFLEPIFNTLDMIISPAIKAIVWVLEPLLQSMIPILEDVRDFLNFANEQNFGEEYEEFKKSAKENIKEYYEDVTHMERREGETVSEKYQPREGGPRRVGEGDGWYPGKYAKDTWDGVSGGWW
jgi:hypothetical protein